MSSSNNTDSGNNGNGTDKIDWQHVAMPDLIKQVEDLLEVQIAKFNTQSHCQHDKLMKWAAKQEVQRKAKEERRKAKEEAKRVAEEEVRKLAEQEAKKKAEEDAQKRAKFQAWWKANSERKVREKAEVKVAMEVMRVQIAQKAGQGEKPKPKPKQRQAASQCMPNEEVQRWYPHKMEVKCYFKVSMATMKRSASGEKCKESETSATVVATSPQGGEKCKRSKRVVADVASTKEIKEALGGFSVAGTSTQPDPVAQVLDWRLGEVIAAIDRNTRELAWLGGKMDSFVWEMKRMANHSDRKGKGKAWPEETKEEEEKSDNVSDADAEGEDVDE
ncbi:hypothetical protein SCLCIDRAFT_22290 [Scleroderma citrinum Foug A]|uniref:Uncharacterized protein n=1 Tax=Scleroderma citrinum Foug A TaxID=1036808 RepID=A0A0C3DZV6_9AGAM|nr:hypothetical protein SCLCIDRAFT_22290 [Scleroderma citrinum Foug A]